MLTWIQSRAFSSVVGMLLFTATLMGLWLPVLNPLAIRARSAPIAASTSGVFDSAEMELLTQELRKQKETLNAREKDLQQLAERLQSERNELYALTQAVARAQSDFDRRLVRIREQETTNLKRLGKTYASMTPDAAASVLGALDDTTVVKILATMKESEGAALLEALARKGEAQAKRVALLSDQLRLTTIDSAASP